MQIRMCNGGNGWWADLWINGEQVCVFGRGKTEEITKEDIKKQVARSITELQTIDWDNPVYVDEQGGPVVINYAVEMRRKARNHKPVIQIHNSGEGKNTPSVAHLELSPGIRSIGLFGFGRTEEMAKKNLREKIDALIQALQSMDYNEAIYVDGDGDPIGERLLKLSKKMA